MTGNKELIVGVLFERVRSHFVGVYRAVSPVVGVALMVIIVVMLAATTAGFALTFEDTLESPDIGTPEATDGSVNAWSDDDLLAPENATAGAEDVRYKVVFEVEADDSVSENSEDLSNIDVVVDTGDDMFTGVDDADFERLEVNGVELDVSAEDISWSADSGGSELNVEFSDVEYDPEEGDKVVLVFGGVDNPEDPGTYDVDVELNGDDSRAAELEIVE